MRHDHATMDRGWRELLVAVSRDLGLTGKWPKPGHHEPAPTTTPSTRVSGIDGVCGGRSHSLWLVGWLGVGWELVGSWLVSWLGVGSPVGWLVGSWLALLIMHGYCVCPPTW